MNIAAMEQFLSGDSIKKHLEYTRTLRSRHSIAEKSYEGLKGKDARQIAKLGLKRDATEQILSNLTELVLHETFFSSFTEIPKPSRELRKYYSSEDTLCYMLVEMGMKCEHGFVYLYLDGRGRPVPAVCRDYSYFDTRLTPLLAIDLCEHAYYQDYGFDKMRYLRSAAARLDLTRLFTQ